MNHSTIPNVDYSLCTEQSFVHNAVKQQNKDPILKVHIILTHDGKPPRKTQGKRERERVNRFCLLILENSELEARMVAMVDLQFHSKHIIYVYICVFLSQHLFISTDQNMLPE
jgi:hypothetical protein